MFDTIKYIIILILDMVGSLIIGTISKSELNLDIFQTLIIVFLSLIFFRINTLIRNFHEDNWLDSMSFRC
jgi:hypothetical protein